MLKRFKNLFNNLWKLSELEKPNTLYAPFVHPFTEEKEQKTHKMAQIISMKDPRKDFIKSE